MTNKNNKILKIELPVRKIRLARSKGRKFSNISISLTEEQIHWLATKPNASEIIRKLLDDLIAAGKDIEPKLEVISLNNQITELEEKAKKLCGEQMHYVSVKHEEKLWKTKAGDFIDWEDLQKYVPKPLETENSQIAYRVVKGYVQSIASIEAKIAELKAKILQLE